MNDSRLEQLRQWLIGLQPQWQLDLASLAPASADASFRRYFRIQTQNPQFDTFIVVIYSPVFK